MVNISYTVDQFAKIKKLILTNRVGRWFFKSEGNWIKFFYSHPGIVQDFLISAQFTLGKNEFMITKLYVSENVKLMYAASAGKTIDSIAVDAIKECFDEMLEGRSSEIKHQSTGLDMTFFQTEIVYSTEQFSKIHTLIKTDRYLRGRWEFYLDRDCINFFYSDPGNVEDILIKALFAERKNKVVITGLYVSDRISMAYGILNGQTIYKIAVDVVKKCFDEMLTQPGRVLNL